jgi:chromosome partitioning protein
MGRTIVVASAKGGVGKTTTVLNLGHALSRFAGRVLLLDADPQGGLANASNLRARASRGLMDVLAGRARLAEAITPSRDPALSILGIGQWDEEDAALFEESAALGSLTRLVQEAAAGYDITLVDAPAGQGTVVRGLLAAGDGLLCPVVCRSLAVKTLPVLLRLLGAVREAGHAELGLTGILITDRDALSRAQYTVYEELRRTLPADALFETVIPHDERVEEASLASLPVALIPGGETSRAADAYFRAAAELMRRETQRRLSQQSEEHDDEPVGLF